MWKCKKCGSNLLGTTVACPICQMPDGGNRLTQDPPQSEAQVQSNKTWILIVIGVLIPPLGILFLLMFLAHKSTPDDRAAN